MHHPDDDRRGPPAVLRGAGVRRRGAQVRQARVGRRRRPAPARRGHGPGRRCLQRDGGLLVRRYLRVPGRPAARRERPPLQGVVRHGLGARGAQPHVGGVVVRPRPQGAVRGGHLHLADVPRPGPPGRRGPDRLDHRGRPLLLHLRRRGLPGGVRRAGHRRHPERGRLRRGQAAARQLELTPSAPVGPRRSPGGSGGGRRHIRSRRSCPDRPDVRRLRNVWHPEHNIPPCRTVERNDRAGVRKVAALPPRRPAS
ncbi:hypothetical protein SGPA1_20415 [Streptomyces misionensis JCM 4497]